MFLVKWILVAATFSFAAAQVLFPDEINTQEENNNNNNNQQADVDSQLLQLIRIANSQTDGSIPSSPVGPDRPFVSGNKQSLGTGGALPPSPLINPDCQDRRPECPRWAQSDECRNNIDFMAPHCESSCGYCDNPDRNCKNNSDFCVAWYIRGECQSNPDYMRDNCKAACKACGKTSLPFGLIRGSGANPPGIVIDTRPPGFPSN